MYFISKDCCLHFAATNINVFFFNLKLLGYISYTVWINNISLYQTYKLNTLCFGNCYN